MGHWSLHSRVAATLAAAATALLVIGAGLLVYYNYRLLIADVESAARRTMQVLAAVHTQSMLHRASEDDRDPAIAVLNGTFEHLDRFEPGLKSWLVVGPKVAAFQRARGSRYLELPVDALDRQALETGRVASALIDKAIYRRVEPVLLGVAQGDNPACFRCHGDKMGIARGEVIGAYSVSIDLGTRWAGFVSDAQTTLAGAIGIAALLSWLTAWLVNRLAGEPLTRMTEAMARLASGDLEVEVPRVSRKDEIGALAGALAVFRQNALRHREAEGTLRLLSQATEQSTSAVVITDASSRIVYVNPMFSTIMGYAPEEVLGKNPSVFGTRQTSQGTYDDLWKTLCSGRPWRGELLDRTKSGVEIWIGTTIAPVLDASGAATHYVATYIDISERRRAEERLSFLAYHDPLTGLPNRTLFGDRLTMALRVAERAGTQVAVLLLDIKNFSAINDTLGHAEGDLLICSVSERLRNSDTLARGISGPSRMGGDEFAIILPEVDGMAGAGAVAARMLGLFDAPFRVAMNSVRASASVGIALFPDHGRSEADLLRRADLALHVAKRDSHSNFAFFAPAMESEAVQRVGLAHELVSGMDAGQFHLMYQPQVDPRTSRLLGLEALLRWKHPDRGFVSPAAFIPIAESSGAIAALGRWVIEETCRQLAAWREAGLENVPVAVNLSPLQVSDRSLVDHIRKTVARYGIAPEWLPLEITESSFLQHSESVSWMMAALMGDGHRFVLDDFGTGYSSLSYLSRYPFAKIKIDRAFVTNVEENTSNAAIVRATIALGHELGMKVTAEGVETRPELTVLRGWAVDEIQGYLFSKPIDSEAVAELLRSGIVGQERAGLPV